MVEILKEWALLLTKDHKLFRCSSSEQLLPIIHDSASEVVDVIEKILRGPFLNNEIVPVEVVKSLCPKVSDHRAILKNLYYLYQEFPFSDGMTVQTVGILISYFSNIHLRNEAQCCKHLKCLPLFEAMDGSITVLEGKRVYVWPNNICQDGNEKWMKGTDLVFLKPWGAWSNLGVYSELGIQKITAEETYIQFIFPHFFKMRKNERYSHLKYIRDYLFESNFSQRKSNNLACNFVLELKKLPWIGDDDQSLKPVSAFYTDQKKIFHTFPDHFELIPREVYQGDKKKWMSFFQKIGLQQKVTTATFAALCSDVAGGKLKEATITSSNVLLDYLLSKEEAKYNGFHSDKKFLTKISDIPFVSPIPMPELEWIHKAHQTPSHVVHANNNEIPLCKLSGSCMEQYKDLIWVVKHVIHVSGQEEESVLEDLGICSEPTVKDVVGNVKHLANTCFANTELFTRYTAPHSQPGQEKLMDIMTKMFEYLQQFKEEHARWIELKALPCIPVHAVFDKEGSQYPVLVHPHCVVFRPTKETQEFYPFIHGLNRTLNRAIEFLELLGVKNSIELNHMQIVLQSAYKVSEGMEMDLNTRRVVCSAIKEISSILQRDAKTMGEEMIIEDLKPLYLPGTDQRMHPVESLVYTSTYRYEYNLNGTGLFLLWTPEDVPLAQFCQLLPEAIRPKPLSGFCIKRVSPSCKRCESRPELVSQLERVLRLQGLPQAMSHVVQHYASKETRDRERMNEDDFTECVETFFESIKVCCVEGLTIDVFFTKDDTNTLITSGSKSCFLSRENNSYSLFMDSNIRFFALNAVQDSIVNELISYLKTAGFIEETLYKAKDVLKGLLCANSSE